MATSTRKNKSKKVSRKKTASRSTAASKKKSRRASNGNGKAAKISRKKSTRKPSGQSNGKKSGLHQTFSLRKGPGPEVPLTSHKEIERIFELQQASRQRMKETTVADRKRRLKQLRLAIIENRQELFEALRLDFNKAPEETELTEILPTLNEITDSMKHIRSWMAPKRVSTPKPLMGTSSRVIYEPRGTVLIISPWNYPFHLAIAPLIAAISAGNTSIIKPSEFTPHTSRFLKQILGEIFPEDEVAVVEGDHTTSQKLTSLPFDHIFFTGSTPVGKIIMKAAAEHLATVTLELGGKSPVIVDKSADLRLTARRVMWGKGVNAGQTCIAPDYLFIPEDKLEEFIIESKAAIEKYYGESAQDRKLSGDFCRIISHRHHNRLAGLLKDAVKKGARIRMGGEIDNDDNFIEPTILTGVDDNFKIMQEEIFGPILPVMTYKSLDEVYDYIRRNDKPLALYIFSQDQKMINDVLANTTAGGTTINDVMLHLANGNMPFGGVNQSGHGAYHGEYGFKALSHERAVLKQRKFSSIELMYPPYTKSVERIINLTRKFLV